MLTQTDGAAYNSSGPQALESNLIKTNKFKGLA